MSNESYKFGHFDQILVLLILWKMTFPVRRDKKKEKKHDKLRHSPPFQLRFPSCISDDQRSEQAIRQVSGWPTFDITLSAHPLTACYNYTLVAGKPFYSTR